jgi:hypothetical protein
MKRILNYGHFVNENNSNDDYSHLYEGLNYSKSDVMSFVKKEMYNKTIEFIFGKDCVGKSMEQIEQMFTKNGQYVTGKSGTKLFPFLEDRLEVIWGRINRIVDPKSNTLNKITFDFKLDELKTFQNLKLQKSNELNVLNDKKSVENLIRKGKLKSTLGTQYDNLTNEQKEVIDLVNDYMDDKSTMIKNLYQVLSNSFDWNAMKDGFAPDYYIGYKEITARRNDLNRNNIGYYFLALITNYIYTFFVNVVAEEVVKSYKASTTTMKTPTTNVQSNVARNSGTSSVSRSAGTRSAGTRSRETVSSGSEKSGGTDYAKMFGY